jgi:hypothetical protein
MVFPTPVSVPVTARRIIRPPPGAMRRADATASLTIEIQDATLRLPARASGAGRRAIFNDAGFSGERKGEGGDEKAGSSELRGFRRQGSGFRY